MVHHKIQKKKRNKLKSVDPFNPNARKGKNLEPKNYDQPLPSNVKDIILLSKSDDSKKTKRKPKKKNLIHSVAERAGFKMKKHEGLRSLLRRMGDSIHNDISDIKSLAKHDVAGRDFREIDEEYKKIDEEKARKKDMKQKMRKSIADKSSKIPSKQNEPQQSMISNENGKAIRNKQLHPKLESKKEEESELILNAKEVIPFGSRVDAPPEFRKRMCFQDTRKGPSSIKKVKNTGTVKVTDKKKELEKERNRVIEAYRAWKRR